MATRILTPASNDASDVLMLASREYVDDRPVIAGELADTVDLGPEDPLPPEEPGELTPPSTTAEAEDDARPSRPTVKSSRDQAGPDPQEDPQAELRVLQHFLVGVGKAMRAQQSDDTRVQRLLRMEAAKRLAKAREGGFPPGRAADGNRVLGETLFHLGRYNDALAPLKDALDDDPTFARELIPNYAEALRRSTPTRAQEALELLQATLKKPSLTAADRMPLERIQIQTLVDVGRFAEARERIDAVLAASTPQTGPLAATASELRDTAGLMRGVIAATQLDRSKASRAEVAAAIAMLRETQRTSDPEVGKRARVWIARMHRLANQSDAALIELTEVRQSRPLTGIGILAGLEEMELLGDRGRGVELLQTVRYLVREIGDSVGFDAQYVPIEQFQTRTIAAIDDLRRSGDFKHSIQCAQALPPLFSQADSLVGEGRGYAAWADDMLGDRVGADSDRATARLARARYRSAGDALAAAAQKLFGTEDYLSTQWAAIEAYQKGRHYSRSIRLLELYLRYEARNRQSRGLLAMGRALLARGDNQRAREYFESCIVEQPRDPLRYDARLLLAQTLEEMDQPEAAEEQLIANLRDGSLTPRSPAYRQSLFQLGGMLYRQVRAKHVSRKQGDPPMTIQQAKTASDRLRTAIRYLDEGVDRYWADDDALAAAYEAADAHRYAATQAQIQASQPDMLEAARRNLLSDAEMHIRAALNGFALLSKHLIIRQDDGRLDELQSRLLRNSLMGQGDLLRDLGEYDEAAKAYRVTELRYINTPISLEAMMRRSDCLRRLGRDDQANLLIRQADAALARITPQYDELFAQVTRYNRQQWQDYLGWLANQIQTPGS
ncbi:MAG: tetratricopeptide repeat protein [Planctomycetota bacterium]